MFLLISTHSTATLGIPLPPLTLKSVSLESSSGVEPRDFTPNLTDRLRSLYAQSFRTTLATYVLPRLLAHSLPWLIPQVPSFSSSLIKELYNPKTFFIHAALLGQSCLHCPIFPTAASRRSLDRISVPVWPITLSGRLIIVALVGRYPYQLANDTQAHLSPDLTPLTPARCHAVVLCGISSRFQLLSPCDRQIAHALLTSPPLSY